MKILLVPVDPSDQPLEYYYIGAIGEPTDEEVEEVGAKWVDAPDNVDSLEIMHLYYEPSDTYIKIKAYSRLYEKERDESGFRKTATLYYPDFDQSIYTLKVPGPYDNWDYQADDWAEDIDLVREGVLRELGYLFDKKINSVLTFNNMEFAGGITQMNIAHTMYAYQSDSSTNVSSIKISLASGHIVTEMGANQAKDYFIKTSKYYQDCLRSLQKVQMSIKLSDDPESIDLEVFGGWPSTNLDEE